MRMSTFPTWMAITLALLVGVLGAGAALAQEPAERTVHPARLHRGTCEEPGEEVVRLPNVAVEATRVGTAATGPSGGPEAAIPAGQSVTDIEPTLEELLASPHAVAVAESAAAPDRLIACGAVGGTAVDGDLVVGLRERGGSGHAGVAWFNAADGGTTVTLFLAPGLTGAAQASPAAGTASGAMDAVAVVDRVRPAVVTVVNQRQLGPFGGGQPQEAGRGTGFIIDEQGHVVTNEHVVRRGDAFEVILADGERRAATLVGKDRLSDLAVVRIEGDVPATVGFGDSDALQVGQPVLAIGSPLGEFTNTVTDGIVSALNRDFPGQTEQGLAAYSNLIQHNASINPGNSGGPLVDAAGQVIGVNTLGIPRVPGLGTPVQGIFFAIPSNTVREIVGQLIQDGRVVYPYLGVDVQPVTPELASQYGLPVDYGAYVVALEPGGPAARAGIWEDDIITALGGQRVDREHSFAEVLFAHEPGETVEVTVNRGGQEQRLQVTLGERPQASQG